MLEEGQKFLLKRARIDLISVQASLPAMTEEYEKLNDIVAIIENILGIE